jgi:TolB protein
MTIQARKAIVFGSAASALGLLLFTALPSHAEQSAGPDDTVHFRIQAGGRDLYKVAVPLPLGADAATNHMVIDVLGNDLALSGFFKVLDSKSTLANLAAEGLTINPPDWKSVGAEGVVKGRATAMGNDIRLEFRLYEVARGGEAVLAKDYRGPRSELRQLLHAWAGEVVRYYTNEKSFFNSQIVFSSAASKMRRDLWVMDWDGAGAHAVTRSSQNILPTWSPSGYEIAFTSYLGGKPDLYVMASNGGKPRVLSARPGLNMGASYSPDGSKVAATLSQDGNSEIYLLDAKSGAVLKRLTNSPFIDTSPSFSPDGSRIAFVSDRHGSPQIWMMAADGSGQTRVTRRGNYNQTPKFCPKKDLPLIAFTARDERFAYDIFTVNVDSGEMTRITEGHGSNQNPSWAPNGRAVTYESSRGGVWISTADGRTERQVFRGAASAPAWGPSRK